VVETAGHLDYSGDAVQWGGDGDRLGGAVPETELTIPVTTEHKHLATLSARWGWGGWWWGGGVSHYRMMYINGIRMVYNINLSIF
jgi:hypothetical protein